MSPGKAVFGNLFLRANIFKGPLTTKKFASGENVSPFAKLTEKLHDIFGSVTQAFTQVGNV